MHNRKNLVKEQARPRRLSMIEERRRSEWDRGYRTRRQTLGEIQPEDSDAIYHDTRDYNVDGDRRTKPAHVLPNGRRTITS